MHTNERRTAIRLGGVATAAATRERRTVSRGTRGGRPRLASPAARRATRRVMLVVLAALGVLACGTPTAPRPLPPDGQGGAAARVELSPATRPAATVSGDSTVVPPAPADSASPDTGKRISW